MHITCCRSLYSGTLQEECRSEQQESCQDSSGRRYIYQHCSLHSVTLCYDVSHRVDPADPENADLDPHSVHAVAAAVGSFFRELPEPLLTREMYMEFIRAMGK